jgi:DNA mismatch endonuclease (patch repair protein)
MADTVSPNIRSRIMAAVKSRDTKPELEVRRALHAAGFRYRLHRRDLPGRPDIALPRFKIAVFVHGCFWHGHKCARGRPPASNKVFWSKKIGANADRDRRNLKALRSAGWKAFVIWTCDLELGIARVTDSLRRLRTTLRLN